MRLVTFRDPHGSVRVGRLDGDGEDARVVELAAPTMLDWLRGDGHEPAGRDHALADVALLAPVPEPPSVRDFFAYEGHVATGWTAARRGEIPEAWYEAPVFYFSNPASIQGPGAAGQAPAGRLRVAGLRARDRGRDRRGRRDRRLHAAQRLERARHPAPEMTVGLGPAKGKDFATSLGPVARHARRAALSRTAACS